MPEIKFEGDEETILQDFCKYVRLGHYFSILKSIFCLISSLACVLSLLDVCYLLYISLLISILTDSFFDASQIIYTRGDEMPPNSIIFDV